MAARSRRTTSRAPRVSTPQTSHGARGIGAAGTRAADRRDTYDFTHDLVRQAAYRTVSQPRRKLLHRHIARAFDAAVGRDPALAADLAYHAARADDFDVAARACILRANAPYAFSPISRLPVLPSGDCTISSASRRSGEARDCDLSLAPKSAFLPLPGRPAAASAPGGHRRGGRPMRPRSLDFTRQPPPGTICFPSCIRKPATLARPRRALFARRRPAAPPTKRRGRINSPTQRAA